MFWDLSPPKIYQQQHPSATQQLFRDFDMTSICGQTPLVRNFWACQQTNKKRTPNLKWEAKQMKVFFLTVEIKITEYNQERVRR